MSPTPEHFEKLEAYLDGALDAAATEQVKRELEADPQLRAMMVELAAMRQWVGGLPRASAPADLIESFQGQLERTALLGESVTEEADGIMRIDRWSNVMSIAAILLLAAGLSLLIYKVLPDKHATEIASRLPAPGDTGVQGPEAGSNEERQPSTSSLDVNAIKGARSDSEKEMREATTNPVTAFAGGGGGGAGGVLRDAKESISAAIINDGVGQAAMSSSRPAEVLSQPTPVAGEKGVVDKADVTMKNGPTDRTLVSADDVREIQQRIARGGTIGTGEQPLEGKATAEKGGMRGVVEEGGEEPVVLLVKSQDPRQAMQDVSEFLLKNSVTYVCTTTDGTRKSGQSIDALDAAQITPGAAKVDKDNASQGMRRAAASSSGGFNGGKADNYASNATTMASNGGAYGNSDRATQNQAAQPTVNVSQNLASNSATAPSNSTVADAQASLQPTTAQADTNHSLLALRNGGATYDLSKPAIQPAANSPSGNGYGSGSTYRAMMTNRQQIELNDFISRRGNQWAERQRDVAAPATEKAKSVNEDSITLYRKSFTVDADPRSKNSAAANSPGVPEAPAGAVAKAQDPSMVKSEARNFQNGTDSPTPSTLPVLRSSVADGLAAKKSDPVSGVLAEKIEPAPATHDAAARKPAPVELVDAPREVMIVVPDQAVILPTALPGFLPTTQPANMEAKAAAVPTTSPATAPLKQPAGKY
jgi:hypothetical protein